jgi:hypothetical protein
LRRRQFAAIDLHPIFHGALDGQFCHHDIIGNVDAIDAARFQIVNVTFGVKGFRHKQILNEATKAVQSLPWHRAA